MHQNTPSSREPSLHFPYTVLHNQEPGPRTLFNIEQQSRYPALLVATIYTWAIYPLDRISSRLLCHGPSIPKPQSHSHYFPSPRICGQFKQAKHRAFRYSSALCPRLHLVPTGKPPPGFRRPLRLHRNRGCVSRTSLPGHLALQY